MKQLHKWDIVAIVALIGVVVIIVGLSWVKYYQHPQSTAKSLDLGRCRHVLQNFGRALLAETEIDEKRFPSRQYVISEYEERCPITQRKYVYIGGQFKSITNHADDANATEMVDSGYYLLAFDRKPHGGVRHVLFNDSATVECVSESTFRILLAESIKNAPDANIRNRLVDWLVKSLRKTCQQKE